MRGWLNACATNWFAAGNTIYVGDNHAESQATAITIAPAGSCRTIGKILCHNHSGSYPPHRRFDNRRDDFDDSNVSLTYCSNSWITVLCLRHRRSSRGWSVSLRFQHFLIDQRRQFILYFDNCSFQDCRNCCITAVHPDWALQSAGVMIWNNCTVSFGSCAAVSLSCRQCGISLGKTLARCWRADQSFLTICLRAVNGGSPEQHRAGGA